jgi:hypothetical protein
MGRVILKESLCISFALLAVALCNGCATHDLSRNGAIPPGKVPDWRVTVPVTTIETLQPAFAWAPSKESGVSYDLIICVGINEPHGYWIPGKTAYYRQGITTATHTLEQPLVPGTVYVWSVRARSGNRTSLWAAYNDSDPSLFQKGRRRYNMMYPFKTPGD